MCAHGDTLDMQVWVPARNSHRLFDLTCDAKDNDAS